MTIRLSFFNDSTVNEYKKYIPIKDPSLDSRIWHWFNKHGDTSKSSDDLSLKLAWTKSVMIDLISVGSCSSEFNCFSVYPKLKEKMCQNYNFVVTLWLNMNEYSMYLESSNEQTVTDGNLICSMEICATEVIIGCFSHWSMLLLMTTRAKSIPPVTTKTQIVLPIMDWWRLIKLVPWIEELSQNWRNLSPNFEAEFSFFSKCTLKMFDFIK